MASKFELNTSRKPKTDWYRPIAEDMEKLVLDMVERYTKVVIVSVVSNNAGAI